MTVTEAAMMPTPTVMMALIDEVRESLEAFLVVPSALASAFCSPDRSTALMRLPMIPSSAAGLAVAVPPPSSMTMVAVVTVGVVAVVVVMDVCVAGSVGFGGIRSGHSLQERWHPVCMKGEEPQSPMPAYREHDGKMSWHAPSGFESAAVASCAVSMITVVVVKVEAEKGCWGGLIAGVGVVSATKAPSEQQRADASVWEASWQTVGKPTS